MHGTFNGLPLNDITSITTAPAAPGFEYHSFRVLCEPSPDLERALQLNTRALLILASREIEGRIVRYSADIHSGYEVTIESRKGTEKQ